MFVLTCTCGNEIFGDEEDAAAAWQCDLYDGEES